MTSLSAFAEKCLQKSEDFLEPIAYITEDIPALTDKLLQHRFSAAKLAAIVRDKFSFWMWVCGVLYITMSGLGAICHLGVEV